MKNLVLKKIQELNIANPPATRGNRRLKGIHKIAPVIENNIMLYSNTRIKF